MSIKDVSNNNSPEPKESTNKESRFTQAASLFGAGLRYSYRSIGSITSTVTSTAGSITNTVISTAGTVTSTAISHIPRSGYLFSEKFFLDKIERLSSVEYQELLEFISTGNPALGRPAYKSLLEEIANHWQDVQTLIKIEQPSTRLVNIVGTAQISPLLLFKLLNQFSQQNIWKYLAKDLIVWPVENCDEAMIHRGLEGGQFTSQFYRDHGRSDYVVDSKSIKREFFRNYEGDKLKDLLVALQQLPVFKGIQTIPFPIQEMLTQTTTISYVLIAIWASLNSSSLPPPNLSQRTLIIEEGNDSCFFLEIQEKLIFPGALSFDYSYRFKISKVSQQEWSSELISLSSLEPTIGQPSIDLFEKCLPSDPESHFGLLFDNLILSLDTALRAAIVCNDLEALARIEKQIQKRLNTLSTQFSPKFWTKDNQRIKTLLATLSLAETAKTTEGKQILVKMQVVVNNLIFGSN